MLCGSPEPNLDAQSTKAVKFVNNFDLIDVDQANTNYVGMSSAEIVISQQLGELVELGQFLLGIVKFCAK